MMAVSQQKDDVQAYLSLTPQHLIPFIKTASNLWEGGWLGGGVFHCLRVPESKQQEIREQYGSDEDKAIEKCIEWWVEHATDVSWRKVIHSLYKAKESTLADSLRQYAEPPSDRSITSHSVYQVMEVMREGEWMYVGDILSVPYSIMNDIMKCSTLNEKISALSNYVATILPGVTWEMIASVLYSQGEDRAVERVKEYLHIVPDPTLTTYNVVEMTKSLGYDNLHTIFNASYGKYSEIREQYQSDEQRCEALIAHALATHPCISWNVIADRLQKRGYNEDAAEITRKYVKASDESKEMLLKGLKESTSKVRNNTFVIIGAAGSGKTSVMAVMMDKDPPETRTSTGCTTCPVRGMTTTRIGKSDRMWKHISYNQLSRQLATAAVKIAALHRAGNTLCVQLEDRNTTCPESASSGELSQVQVEQVLENNDVTPTGTVMADTQANQPTQLNSSIVEELGSMLEGRLLDGSVEILEMDWINILDSGGQPAFHELLPFFVHNPSAALFTFKLSEALSSHYTVTYYKDGKAVGKPYHSSLNNEQILSTCMRTIPSQVCNREVEIKEGKSNEKGEVKGKVNDDGRDGEDGREEKGVDQEKKNTTKYAFIGTHRDEETHCTDETRADKEKKIEAMIPPSLRPHVLRYGEEMDKFIFAVNSKNPEKIDRDTIAQLRGELVDKSPAEWKEIPTSFYAIDLALQALAQRLGRYVVTIEECKQEAENLQMDERSMMAALRYLHELNILFYYHEENALPGIVFVNGQVLLDKITELVEKSHQLRDNPCSGVAIAGEWEKFRNHAIVTKDQLKGFSKHYQEGLFSVDDLIRLFTFKPILAPLGKDRFLIPAILPAESTERLVDLIQSKPYHLLFFFPGGIPFGVFCALNASVINHSGWNLLEESGRPVQVSRNCITYTLPDDEPGKISLIDTHSNYIAVVVEVEADEALAVKTCQRLCPIVRGIVYRNIQKSVTALHYTNTIPRYGFFCPGSSCSTTSHVAIINNDHTVITCSQKRSVIHSITDSQSVWLNGLTPAIPTAVLTLTTASGMDKRPTLLELYDFPSGGGSIDIIEKIGINYNKFGSFLLEDKDGDKMKVIVKECRGDVADINREIFFKWINGGGKWPVNWCTLVTVLNKCGLIEIAKTIIVTEKTTHV